ncbi:glucose-1-phosphate adenylyltransferase [candidate division KSB1 bacterium]|nr:glucose-1-phosphate adenylyltransferase [candidate division KSB1 bacterium]NIR73030.1 glucose-1-phosphate adenylyltransferase [candidate division KSB1 bacterium]NIS23810.1 glucose-1-phosphate adenylyltransferase [candidate division KSB1 bacterium]NIT70737.1 glucose-1-phosphate adenylyltransferase [candidate division KSB1 bacterium]NIU24460.1 glucose-1-phosphate adenylyltransferase [candidate division KSB1 bacterium]
MKNVLALILAGGRVDELSVLTLTRPKSTVPFGGMYRVIDFPLSNLMHSEVERVGVLGQYRSLSLFNHVGVGAWWDFVGRDRGAFMLTPSTGHAASDWYKGTADAVYQNLDFVQEQAPEIVLILSGDHIYKMDYRRMLNYHLEKNADLTIAFFPIEIEESNRFGVADIDDEDGNMGGTVIDYKEKPAESGYPWASLTIYLFKPAVLYDLLDENARKASSHEFGRDIISKMLGKYRVYGYKFYDYWGYTRTIDEYWQTNMHLLQENPKIDLDSWQVRTNLDHDQLRDRPPMKAGEHAKITTSLVYNGCEVEGEVLNSILFPGVKIEKHAVVKDSILFYDAVVKSGGVVDKTITDVDVIIGEDSRIGHGDDLTANQNHPNLLNTGINLIGRDVHVPPKLSLGRNCIVYPSLKEADFDENRYESGITIS